MIALMDLSLIYPWPLRLQRLPAGRGERSATGGQANDILRGVGRRGQHQHQRPEQRGPVQGARVSALRRPGRVVRQRTFLRRHPRGRRQGVPGAQSHLSG